MGVEMLKILAALGTGIVGVIGAYVAGFTPPEGTSPTAAVVMVAVLSLIKRGIDALVAKITPPAPTS